MLESRLRSLLLIAALTPPALPAQGVTVRDSAGVRIVENPAVLGTAPRYTLSTTPLFTIGGVRDNLDDELNAKIAYPFALHLTSNQILVGNGDHFGIFDQTGHRLGRIGRKGAGPGEFMIAQSGCRFRGDSLMLWDGGNRRVSVWSPAGKLAREFVPQGWAHVTSCLADGSILTKEANVASHREDIPLATYSVVSSSGKVLGNTKELPAPLYSGRVMREVRLGGYGNRFFFVDGIEVAVHVLDRSGKVTELWRTKDRPSPVTEATLKSRPMACSRGQSPTAPCVPMPTKAKTWPTVYGFSVGEDGRLWLRLNHGSSDSLWVAMDSTGRVVGKLELPPKRTQGVRRILHFGRDAVLVFDRDEDGAPRIGSYRMVGADRATHPRGG